MAGTSAGGKLAAKKNRERYGEDFYARIGSKGGTNSTTGGFYYSMVNGLDVHVKAGQRGGTISKRRPKVLEVAPTRHWYDKLIGRK